MLMDVSSTSMQRIKHLQANAKLGPNALVRVGEVTGAKDANIEDLFPPAFYLSLVNGAYRKELPSRLTLASLPKGNPRIVRRLEDYFQANSIASGKFNHYQPADYFFNNKATLLAKRTTPPWSAPRGSSPGSTACCPEAERTHLRITVDNGCRASNSATSELLSRHGQHPHRIESGQHPAIADYPR